MKITSIKTLLLIICCVLNVTISAAQDFVAIPELTQRVMDLTGTLSSDDARHLNGKLQQFEETKGSQIVVLIVPTTQPEEIAQFSIRVADQWKIGRKDVDDGIILIVSKNDRKVRIEVGYGLEGAVPDAYSKRIIENIIVPEFRDGRFNAGIDKGVDALIGLVNGEELPAVTKKETGRSRGSSRLALFGAIFLFILMNVIGQSIKKSPIKIVIAIVVALIAGYLISNILIGIVSLIISLIALFSKSGGGNGGTGGYYGGGFYGGGGSGGSSGGGFGGFSGGGGGFGGGGSSGSW